MRAANNAAASRETGIYRCGHNYDGPVNCLALQKQMWCAEIYGLERFTGRTLNDCKAIGKLTLSKRLFSFKFTKIDILKYYVTTHNCAILTLSVK